MRDLIELLECLNRKERFFLIGQALGNPIFATAPAFLNRISDATGISLPSPDHVHCFMDYHLDWLYAALILSTSDGNGPFESPAFPPAKPGDPPWNVNTNQEDTDLLLAFRTEAITHLVLIEAKAATGWRLNQIASKARRLGTVFGKDGHRFPNVEPRFVLISPRRSPALVEKLAVHPDVPPWMRPHGKVAWVQLHIPAGRLLITRCDASGMAMKTGDHWQVANQ